MVCHDNVARLPPFCRGNRRISPASLQAAPGCQNHSYLKLAIVTETFPPEVNGVAMTFGVIARELGARGHEVTVYRPRRPDLPAPKSHPEFREVAMPGMPLPGYPLLRLGLPAGRDLRRRWTEARPDLVHVATEGPLGNSAVRTATALGIPATSSFHTNFHSYTRDYGVPLLNRSVLAWLRYFHNRTRRTFLPTRELCAELAGLGFAHVTVLSRGIDLRQFGPQRRSEKLRAQWGAGPDDPVVIHAGRLAKEKNYPLLFQCYEAMRAANPRTRFVVAGDGPLRRSVELAHPHIHFIGFMSRPELAEYYASADIYIHASLSETFGNVLTEAMGSGLAVAGFDYAAAKLFVSHDVNGLSVPCDRPEELIAAAVRLATEPDFRQRLRLAAGTSLQSQSWEMVIADFEKQLLEVASESGGASPPTPARVPPAEAMAAK